MHRFRLLLLAVGALVLLLVIGGWLAFSSSFQTWVVRKAIASQPALKATIGEVSAGLNHVTLKDVRLEQDGAVLTAPLIEADVAVLPAALRKNVNLTRLVATGWKLDLSKSGAAQAVPSSMAAASRSDPSAPSSVPVAAQAFGGLLTLVQLPVDLAVDGVQLEGDLVLRELRGSVKIRVTGGGLRAGNEGKFALNAHAALADPAVNVVDLRCDITGAMDTPRTIARMAAKLDAAASGRQFPQGVKLVSTVAVSRAGASETYAISAVSAGREVLHLDAELPHGAQLFAGTWKLDVRDADVVPFAFGTVLPAFAAAGEGKFDADTAFSAVHANGHLTASADRLQVIMPELAPIGELKLAGDFDLARHGEAIAVQKLEATVAAARPVATVRALQPFKFNPRTRELAATDMARELFGVALEGVPLAWAKPFLPDLTASGGDVRGQLTANARGGGVTLRTTAPLTIEALTIAQAGSPLVQQLDVSLSGSADYTPKGWQTEISALTAKSGGTNLLTLAARAGRLSGKEQALKATGKLTLNLPAALAQPVAAASLNLATGEATIDFAASLNSKQEIQAKVALSNLAAIVEAKNVTLPALSAEVRADIAPDGRITFNVPLLLERNLRKSDLTLAGSIAPAKNKVRAIEAQLNSAQLVVDDAQVLAAVLPEKLAPKTDAAARDGAPPWAGLHGAVTLSLQKVIYSDAFEVTNLAGRVQIDAGMVKLEGLQAGLGENGRANLDGTVTFTPSLPQPYTLAADLAIKEFDVAPFFRALDATRPATVEGKFNVSSKLAAHAARLGDLTLGAGGEFQLTSKGGIFRGLPVNVSNLTDNTSKLAGWIASAGSAINSITGKKDAAEVASKAQAVGELARGLGAMPYDQLSVALSRDAALNVTLRDFTLITPEVRLSGGGTVLHKPGSSLLDDSLAMDFRLRALGRSAELLKYLGALEPQRDELGYAACTIPISIGGSLAKVDTSDLNRRLVSVALEKSGVTEIVNRLFGGGK